MNGGSILLYVGTYYARIRNKDATDLLHVFFLTRTFVIRTPGSNFRFLLNRVKNITK